jgi:hypothetical protein
MRKVQLLMFSLVAFVATSCNVDFNSGNFGNPGVKGSGKSASETRSVTGFKGVTLKGTGQLHIDTNGTESLEITADDNLLPYITTEIQGDQLVIGTKDGQNVSPSKDIVYKLSAKTMNSINLAGSGEVDAKGINTDQLKVILGGSGNISVAGMAGQQEATIAGSGNYDGKQLKTKTTSINIAGSGDANVDVSDKLSVLIAGSGSVRYTGDPMVTKNILGSGSVDKQ